MEPYRFDYYSAYEYDEKERAYVFIGALNGRTRGEFIADYERRQAADFDGTVAVETPSN